MIYRLTFLIATVEYPYPIRIVVGIPMDLAVLLQSTKPRYVKMLLDEGIAPTTVPLLNFKKEGEK